MVFIDTPGGKKMPCDARMQKIYVCDQGEGGDIYVTARGVVMRGRTDVEGRTETAYRPHWAVCSARRKPADQARGRTVCRDAAGGSAGKRRTPKLRENENQETFFKVYYE